MPKKKTPPPAVSKSPPKRPKRTKRPARKPASSTAPAAPLAEPPPGSDVLICTTYESAAKALKSRIGVGSVKSLQSWLALGMPGSPGQGVSRIGHFPIDEMEDWAKANLSLTSQNFDAAAAARRQRKEEAEIKRLEDRIAREARKDAVVAGELLPRDVYTAFVTEALATMTNGLVNLPLVLMRAGFVAKPQQAEFVADAQRRIRLLLDDLSTTLARGPEKDR